MASFANKMVPPTRTEGFAHVHVVKSSQDAEALLVEFGCDPARVKGGVLAPLAVEAKSEVKQGETKTKDAEIAAKPKAAEPAKASPERKEGKDSKESKEEDEDEAFFKFPRTEHLFNTGGSAMTVDDLLLDADDACAFYGKDASIITVQGVLADFLLCSTRVPEQRRLMAPIWAFRWRRTTKCCAKTALSG